MNESLFEHNIHTVGKNKIIIVKLFISLQFYTIKMSLLCDFETHFKDETTQIKLKTIQIKTIY